MFHKEIVLRSREGEKLRADLRYMSTGKPKPVILFIHGFKGFKNWGPFPHICEELTKSGFVTISMNFSHNGVGDDLMNFTELDRFAENTISRELDEIDDAIGQIVNLNNIPIESEEVHIDSLGLLGHSRGAANAILCTQHHKMIRAVVAWAPLRTFDRFTERQKSDWKSKGYLEVLNSRTGQLMRMNSTILKDFENHGEQFDILKAANKLTLQEKGLLIITGSEDMTVKPAESHEIYEASTKQFASLRIIPQTGHTFGATHPFLGNTHALDEAVACTVEFFRKYLVDHTIPSKD